MKLVVACTVSAFIAASITLGAAIYVANPNPTSAYKYSPNQIFKAPHYTFPGMLVNGGSGRLGRQNQQDDRGDYYMAHGFCIENPDQALTASLLHSQIRQFYNDTSSCPIIWHSAASTVSVGYYSNGDLNGVIRIAVSQMSDKKVEVVTECEENLWLQKHTPNQTSEATSEPAPGAASSSPQG